MKNLTSLAGAAVFLLSACVDSNTPASQEIPTQADIGIRAFIDVCLYTAPSFKGAASKAAAFGITDVQDMGFAQMGFSADQSIGLQVSPGKECTITTPDRPRVAHLRASFASNLTQATGQEISARFPQVISLNGQSYIIQFDSNGGEAYVILKR